MTDTILKILMSGMSIFSDERRRHFSGELLRLKTNLDREESLTFPDYSDAKVAIARRELSSFTEAYAKEFVTSMKNIAPRDVRND